MKFYLKCACESLKNKLRNCYWSGRGSMKVCTGHCFLKISQKSKPVLWIKDLTMSRTKQRPQQGIAKDKSRMKQMVTFCFLTQHFLLPLCWFALWREAIDRYSTFPRPPPGCALPLFHCTWAFSSSSSSSGCCCCCYYYWNDTGGLLLTCFFIVSYFHAELPRCCCWHTSMMTMMTTTY